MNTPLISIITATYNSSHLLRYAIQSVLESNFQDWELIVVGDCCTDDTESLVKSYNDYRIIFFNLEKNSGQQATPNNFGIKKAKGKYITFLNQDDLFFKNHLSESVREIENTSADFLIIPGIKILKSKIEDFNAGNYQVELCSVHPNGHFSTNVFSVASTWFLRKSTAEMLGPWKMENELYITPSQEWIFRAFLAGVKYHFPHRIGILVILSGERKNSYLQKFSHEHEYFYKRLNDERLISVLLEKAAILAYKELQSQLFFQPKVLYKRVLGLPFDWITKSLKIHPSSFRFWRSWGKRGSLIKKVRKDTGLD